jgi:phosphoheptose isomerase
MHKDTRDRNTYFDHSSLKNYFKEYRLELYNALSSVKTSSIIAAYNLIKSAPRIFVGGNGGSAAISDHLTCDFSKGIDSARRMSPVVTSLCGSFATHSAISNDLGYEKSLSYQLKLQRACKDDVLILISSSGNSPNIIDALDYAKNRIKIIGLTGFDGGKLIARADVSLHVESNNYGIVEDCHQSLMHILAQYIYLK